MKWNHLPKVDFQGQPIGYNVTYRSDDLECDMNFVSVNFTTNTTTLSNLTVYTMYFVNVSAVSSGGVGPESTIKARTGAEGTDVLELIYTVRQIRNDRSSLNFSKLQQKK